jgi:hypothetical protein
VDWGGSEEGEEQVDHFCPLESKGVNSFLFTFAETEQLKVSVTPSTVLTEI